MRLTLQNVTKVVRGQTHLYDIDLDLASGSFNVLLGPTQAGKTSLLRLMAGLDRPTTGAILEDGKDVTAARRAQAQRGDGLPGIRELPQLHRLPEHRLAAAARRASVGERDRRQGAQPRRR